MVDLFPHTAPRTANGVLCSVVTGKQSWHNDVKYFMFLDTTTCRTVLTQLEEGILFGTLAARPVDWCSTLQTGFGFQNHGLTLLKCQDCFPILPSRGCSKSGLVYPTGFQGM